MKHLDLFEWIAPFYAWFYTYQRKGYQKSLERLIQHLDFQALSALDVGCGTGALTHELSHYFNVSGVDGSTKMIQQAKRLNPALDFKVINFNQGLPYLDHSIDLIFSSFVLHGINSDQRLNLLKEMKRVSAHAIIIIDYHEGRHPFISLVEWIEHGDYFNFMDHFKEELENQFESVQILKINNASAFYILT